MTDTIIDPATFGELQETAGADFVTELVSAFLEEAPQMLAEMRSGWSAQSAEPFHRAAHTLKSNSLTFGASTLAAMARELELGEMPAAVAPLDALELEYGRVAAALTELCHG